jgi:hypothetical protein
MLLLAINNILKWVNLLNFVAMQVKYNFEKCANTMDFDAFIVQEHLG